MKTRKANEPAASQPKGKVKIKNLKLTKETLGNLSDQDAGAVKGGADDRTLRRSGGSGGTT